MNYKIIVVLIILVIGVSVYPSIAKKAEMGIHGNGLKLKHTGNGSEFNYFPNNTTIIFDEITIPTIKPIDAVNGSIWMNSNGALECFMGVWKYCSNGGSI